MKTRATDKLSFKRMACVPRQAALMVWRSSDRPLVGLAGVNELSQGEQIISNAEARQLAAVLFLYNAGGFFGYNPDRG
jgi:hypothetical protein